MGNRSGSGKATHRRGRGTAAAREPMLEVLRQRIASHELPPGSRLPEHDLASEFGVSRTRVREVFGILEVHSLIERIPNRGAIVVRLDLKQAQELFDIREMLEGLSARLAAEKVAGESWQDLAELFRRPVAEAVRKGDLDTYLAAVELLRRRMIAAADNVLLANLLDRLDERIQVLMRRIVILPGRIELGLGEHRALVRALIQGKADEAERLKRANIRSARECLLRYQNLVF